MKIFNVKLYKLEILGKIKVYIFKLIKIIDPNSKKTSNTNLRKHINFLIWINNFK